MIEKLAEIDYKKIWNDMALFSQTLVGEMLFSICLVAFLSIGVKVTLMFIADKIGIINHLTSKKLQSLKASFDIVAILSNIILGLLVSDYYNREFSFGLMYALASITLHWYIETGKLGITLSFVLKYINPKTILKRWLK